MAWRHPKQRQVNDENLPPFVRHHLTAGCNHSFRRWKAENIRILLKSVLLSGVTLTTNLSYHLSPCTSGDNFLISRSQITILEIKTKNSTFPKKGVGLEGNVSQPQNVGFITKLQNWVNSVTLVTNQSTGVRTAPSFGLRGWTVYGQPEGGTDEDGSDADAWDCMQISSQLSQQKILTTPLQLSKTWIHLRCSERWPPTSTILKNC